MASHNLAVVLGEVDNHITLGVVEGALCRLGVLPLLSVAGCDLAKLGGIAQDGRISSVVQLRVVGRGTEISWRAISYAASRTRLLQEEAYFFPAATASEFSWALAPAASASKARVEVEVEGIVKSLLQESE